MKKNRFYFKIATILLAACLIIGYATYELRNYFSGPEITVTSPANGATLLSKEALTIEGVTKNAATVFMDGQRILIDDKGQFKERLLLADGYNIIGLKVEDKFKRTAEQRLELIYKK